MEVDSITDVLTATSNGDEDPYKSEGQITLKIEKFSEFAHEGPKSRRLSDPVYIRGLPWKILAIPKMEHGAESTQKCLGYYLECNADNKDPSWNCSSNVKLKLLSQKPEKEDYVREFSHVFNAKTDDWGYKQFMNFEDIMNPEKGWYDEKKDTIVLLVDVKADLPHGIKSLQGIKEKEKEIQINNSLLKM
uniref:MATH domain-containing protein n=1 Tax=Meloidogyne incognita TaxID=6306 RepID=A0A914MN92_MELIC